MRHISAIAEAAETSAAPAEPAKEKKNPQALPKKAIMFGGIGIIALVVTILAASIFSGGGSNDNYALCLKDGEIVCTDDPLVA